MISLQTMSRYPHTLRENFHPSALSVILTVDHVTWSNLDYLKTSISMSYTSFEKPILFKLCYDSYYLKI